MKQVVVDRPGSIAVREAAEAGPGPGEVLIEVAYCGICGSDLHVIRGEHPFVVYPVTPGHEFSGIVLDAGEGVSRDLVGERVSVEPSLYCGECGQCRAGRYNICSALKVMGFQAPGAMTERLAVPAHRLHPLPAGVGMAAGALVEPAAVAVHALSRSGAGSGAGILVVGAGVIGLMVLKVAAAAGCRVTMVESTPERARRAGKFGADEVFVFDDVIPEQLAGEAFDAVFECVGRPETIDLAVRSAPRGGRIVAVGVFPGSVPVPMSLVQDGELELVGTLMYMGDDFRRAIELVESGAVTTEDFVTDTFGIDDVEAAYRRAGENDPAVLKVFVEIKGDAA